MSSGDDSAAGEALPADPIRESVRRHISARQIAFVRSFLPFGEGSVLNVGCGTGDLVRRMRAEGIRADGADDDEELLKAARRGAGEFFLTDLELRSPEIEAGKYDVTVSTGLLHRLVERDRVGVSVVSMMRPTRPGGYILILDNNPLNPYWLFLMGKFPRDRGPTRMVSGREIRHALAATGSLVLGNYPMGWVGDFTPDFLLPVAARAESVLERIPVLRQFAAFNAYAALKPLEIPSGE